MGITGKLFQLTVYPSTKFTFCQYQNATFWLIKGNILLLLDENYRTIRLLIFKDNKNKAPISSVFN